MPCYITGSREGDLELSIRELRATAGETHRLLCQLCRHYEVNKRLLPPEIAIWWTKHKRIDAKRRARNQ